jgi:FkbM family methyltransferase
MTASFIIDAGANIGDTSLYFLRHFVDSRIVALEPHPTFFRIAEKNLRPYTNATLLRKGLWSTETTLGFADDSTGSSVCIQKPSAIMIETTSVSALLQKFEANHIDILKLDIEGAEQEVLLNNSDSWLSRTAVIVAELHGQQITDRCTSFLRSRGFSERRYRSLHYFVNDMRSFRNQ